MHRFFHVTGVVTLFVAALAGCRGGSNASSTNTEVGKTSDAREHSHGGHVHSHEASIADDVLAALPEEDRAPVKLQSICPVSGEPLGSMGAPVKVVVDDGTAYMCCEGCEEEFRRDPKQYLAKLPASKAP